jgi:tRNA nucleotidyltransferase (CCA-adding enzyme)
VKIYRVGGAVRDRLLGLPLKDIDWVVTGATAEQMLALGYKSIGKDFPVFLHPESKQEYALARSERKTGPGYRGFEIDADPGITIEQDLKRRDLTINAIAEDEDGNLVDPWGGQRDIEARCLRHVSDAFVEDPVRVLRVARFAARFHELGFTLAPETRDLIAQMGASGELDSLVAERVWVELSRALDEPAPQQFFLTLRDCGVLSRLFPEIDALFGVPQTARYHPEVDTGVHLMMALAKSAELGFDNQTRFAVLMHDLGKATTPSAILPSHHGHEQRGTALVEDFCKRWRVPRAHTELALITTEYHTLVHRAFDLKPSTLLKLMSGADSFRKAGRFRKMLDACIADLRGRKGFEDAAYPQAAFLERLGERLRDMDTEAIRRQGLSGKALGEAIRCERLELIRREKALAEKNAGQAAIDEQQQSS